MGECSEEMEIKQRKNNRHYNSRNKNNRYDNNHRSNNRNERQRPQRRRRVTVDRDVEVVIVSNTTNRFYYENPRMNMVIDLHHIGDEEYVTVGDLRTILNSNRKILESFEILITEVVDEQYTVEDVLIFLGLDRKYREYFSLVRKDMNSMAEVTDIKNFLIKAPLHVFEDQMAKMDDKLRGKVIEMSVKLFKLKQFSDYNKMQIVSEYVNEELFDDAKETEIDEDIYI